MNTKFEEAKYINGIVTRMYSVSEISEIRQNNLQRFFYYNGIINDSRKISFLDIFPVD